MAKLDLKVVRLSETISPFGVGAIVDIAGNSLIAMDTSWWPAQSPELSCERLERTLRVLKLKTPPSVPSYPSKKTAGLRYMRFPAWLFCQNCRRMQQWSRDRESGSHPVCSHCSGPMVPMRFIALCTENSHVMDVPWKRWVHRVAETDAQVQCQSSVDMKFETSSTGNEGLSGLRITCKACGCSRHLGELSGKGALSRDGFRCSGKQPWQLNQDKVDCDSEITAVQRGATNMHIAEVFSAIDIPEQLPASELLADRIRRHVHFAGLASSPEGPLREMLAEAIASEIGATVDAVFELAQQKADHGVTEPLDPGLAREDLLGGEWSAFERAGIDPALVNNKHFVTEKSSLGIAGNARVSTELDSLVSSVILIHRLREVRAMTGFRRYSLEGALQPSDMGPTPAVPWYPAVESFGEGIFFSVDETALAQWEGQLSVKERIAVIERRRSESGISGRFPLMLPRAVMLHTLSHLLMRRLAFDSGYSSASLRERVYASLAGKTRQAGVMIYTASGDSEGTLGGLVRQGEPPRLERTLLTAIEDADWCSNDPVCGESRGQGMNALNLAACHACALAPETSCDRSNLFLDRRLVVGDGAVPGFFDTVLEHARITAV